MLINCLRSRPSSRNYLKIRQHKLKVPIHHFCKKRKARAGTIEMEIKNLRLIIKNQNIIEENEKLRKRALQLQQENKDLLSELHKANNLLDANQ